MEEKVSIILPIYNVENYLRNCIKTVKTQTYNNLEIILVDDGSTDSSGEICDQEKEKDSRIKVIHKPNGGLSSARNAGYEVATGKYLMYIDSDDQIKMDIVERCVKAMKENIADLVIYGYEKTNEQGNILEICKWGDKTYNHDEMIEHLFQGITEMSFGYAWNKLYRKDVLDKSGILADSKIIDREDLVYNMELLKYIKKATYIDYVGYSYLQRKSSLLHNSNLARLNGIEYFVRRMKDIKTGNPEADKKVYNMIVLHYLADCIIKNVIWNEELSYVKKKAIMMDILEECPLKEELYDDKENARHLRMLYKTIKSRKILYFYGYVKLADLKRQIKKI